MISPPPIGKNKEPVVYIVDDDDSVRRALRRLVGSLGIRAETFATPGELLEHGVESEWVCLLLDVQLPGMDGIELRERLLGSVHNPPVIFITAHPDERSRSRAAKVNAIAYLEKPVDEEALLAALETALSRIAAGPGRTPVTRPGATPPADGPPAPGRSPTDRPRR